MVEFAVGNASAAKFPSMAFALASANIHGKEPPSEMDVALGRKIYQEGGKTTMNILGHVLPATAGKLGSYLKARSHLFSLPGDNSVLLADVDLSTVSHAHNQDKGQANLQNHEACSVIAEPQANEKAHTRFENHSGIDVDVVHVAPLPPPPPLETLHSSNADDRPERDVIIRSHADQPMPSKNVCAVDLKAVGTAELWEEITSRLDLPLCWLTQFLNDELRKRSL